MFIDKNNLTERQKTMRSYLRRAFEQNRGGEAILLLQWRLAQESHRNSGYVKLARKFLIDEGNAAQPRAIRALNLITQSKGLNVQYRDADTGAPDRKIDVLRYIREAPDEHRILIPTLRMSALIPFNPFAKFAEPDLTPRPFGLRHLSAEKRSLKNMFCAVGEQRDVRMEEVPDKVVSRAGDLELLSATVKPKGYTPH